MGDRVTRLRVQLGRDLVVVGEDNEGVELEGRARLSPGRTVEVVRAGSALVVRTATVASWCLVRMGSDGATYRGFCRWT
jgi:hypothetical protein